ncbi:MAG TPA: hypothetical protein VHM02_10665 [Thermoanaerobaculia bacterium]|nr:hypothetical protein [Thermoanaerobaculia bacterium]
MTVRQHALALALAAATAAAGVAGASEAPVALGSEGEIYRLVAGPYGALVPGGAEAAADDPALALRVQLADGTERLAVVPETAGPQAESSPFLLYEEASRTAFLAWEERTNHIHSRIRLAGYRGGEWTEIIEVSEGAFGFKGEPRLAVTQDSFVVADAEGATRTVSRTVLHVVWVEERTEGQVVAYAPVTLLDGRYIGQRRIFDLSALVGAAEPRATDLWQVAPPVLAAGEDDHSVIVGLVDPDGGRVASVRVAILPGELSMIADELRNHLIDVGVRYDWHAPDGLRRLADDLRNHLIDVGHRIEPQILRHVADDLRNHLIDVGVEYPPAELRRLAGDLRNHLIDVGFRLDARGLKRVTAGEGTRAVIEVGGAADDGGTTTMTQVEQLTVVADWSRPEQAGAGATLLVSRDGGDALVSWSDGSSVFYRETFDGEWSPVMRLPLGGGLDAGEALTVLESRIRNR